MDTDRIPRSILNYHKRETGLEVDPGIADRIVCTLICRNAKYFIGRRGRPTEMAGRGLERRRRLSQGYRARQEK